MRSEYQTDGGNILTAAVNAQPLADEVARRKQVVIRHLGRLRWVRGISLLAGIAIGLGTWFSPSPADRDGLHFGFALGLAGATFFIGGMLGRLLFSKPSAQCPQCGCDWNAESENDVQRLLAWRCCPGCGLGMRNEIRGHEEPAQLNRTNSRRLHRHLKHFP